MLTDLEKGNPGPWRSLTRRCSTRWAGPRWKRLGHAIGAPGGRRLQHLLLLAGDRSVSPGDWLYKGSPARTLAAEDGAEAPIFPGSYCGVALCGLQSLPPGEIWFNELRSENTGLQEGGSTVKLKRIQRQGRGYSDLELPFERGISGRRRAIPPGCSFCSGATGSLIPRSNMNCTSLTWRRIGSPWWLRAWRRRAGVFLKPGIRSSACSPYGHFVINGWLSFSRASL